jgi:hypothetical protein
LAKLFLEKTMKNGTIWLDDKGMPIQAHGGCITKFGEIWYWYGENKGVNNLPGRNSVPFLGISCYSSSNLRDWHFEGNVLSADTEDPADPLHSSKVGERPKVIYNKKNDNYVLWLHVDNASYNFAKAGVAISPSPAGPFTFLEARRVHADCRDYMEIPWYDNFDGA